MIPIFPLPCLVVIGAPVTAKSGRLGKLFGPRASCREPRTSHPARRSSSGSGQVQPIERQAVRRAERNGVVRSAALVKLEVDVRRTIIAHGIGRSHRAEPLPAADRLAAVESTIENDMAEHDAVATVVERDPHAAVGTARFLGVRAIV